MNKHNTKAADSACLKLIAQGYYWNDEAWVQAEQAQHETPQIGLLKLLAHREQALSVLDCQRIHAAIAALSAHPRSNHKLFPINVMGGPMREFSPGKWESAAWPSEQPRPLNAPVVGYVPDTLLGPAIKAFNAKRREVSEVLRGQGPEGKKDAVEAHAIAAAIGAALTRAQQPAAHDAIAALSVQAQTKCSSCHGTGKQNDCGLGDIQYREWTCPSCRGVGEVNIQPPSAPVGDDFCDGHCTWLDHAPGCSRSASSAPVGVEVLKIIDKWMEGYDHMGTGSSTDARESEEEWDEDRVKLISILAQQPAAVDEAMVYRAALAIPGTVSPSLEGAKNIARVVLAAALAQPQGGA